MTEKISPLDKRYVTLGGGTGSFAVNIGLRRYPGHPTAICTVFDSGGSTGRLRDEYGWLPQGDIRRCLLALADDESHVLRELLEYRFPKNGSSLGDHSLGNLLLLAAEQKWGRVEGVRNIGRVLNIKGAVLPVSIDEAHLWAELSDGARLEGESSIDTRSQEDPRSIRRVWLEPSAMACREVVEAISEADIVILGPGDLYTSIIPNLLVEGVTDALNRSKALICYVANIMTKWSETRDYSVVDFVEAIKAYGVKRLDAVLVNTAPLPGRLLSLYEKDEKSVPVACSAEHVQRLQADIDRVVLGDFLNSAALANNLIRHDPHKLAGTIVKL